MANLKRKRSESISSISSVSSSDDSDSGSSSGSGSGSSSGSSSGSERAAKKVRKVSNPDGEWVKGEFVLELSDSTKLTLRKFKGQNYVDIRKFLNDKPTFKGISLKPELLETVLNFKPKIVSALKLVGKVSSKDPLPAEIQSEKIHVNAEGEIVFEISEYVKLKVYTFKGRLLVDIRNFFKGNPTKKGISVSPEIMETVLNKHSWKEWSQMIAKLK